MCKLPFAVSDYVYIIHTLCMFRTVPGTSTDLGGVKVTTNFTRPEPSDSPVPRETSYAPPELLCLKVCMVTILLVHKSAGLP